MPRTRSIAPWFRFVAAGGLAAGLLLLLPSVADAKSVHAGAWAAAQPVTVSIVGEHGDPLPSAAHHGTTFVAGELGHRYEIVLTNQTADRVEVVVSVDGRDVLSGKRADFRKQRGYVIEPFGTVRVDGFRRSLDRVAAFRFADLEDSFAARSGAPQNVGAIGIAVFRERASAQIARSKKAKDVRDRGASTSSPPREPTVDAPAKSAPSASRRPATRADKLGTEFGETRESHVRVVSFTRRDASRPDFRVALQYDAAENLLARGIPIEHVAIRPTITDPDPWPGARDDGFAQPPPPRRR